MEQIFAEGKLIKEMVAIEKGEDLSTDLRAEVVRLAALEVEKILKEELGKEDLAELPLIKMLGTYGRALRYGNGQRPLKRYETSPMKDARNVALKVSGLSENFKSMPQEVNFKRSSDAVVASNWVKAAFCYTNRENGGFVMIEEQVSRYYISDYDKAVYPWADVEGSSRDSYWGYKWMPDAAAEEVNIPLFLHLIANNDFKMRAWVDKCCLFYSNLEEDPASQEPLNREIAEVIKLVVS